MLCRLQRPKTDPTKRIPKKQPVLTVLLATRLGTLAMSAGVTTKRVQYRDTRRKNMLTQVRRGQDDRRGTPGGATGGERSRGSKSVSTKILSQCHCGVAESRSGRVARISSGLCIVSFHRRTSSPSFLPVTLRNDCMVTNCTAGSRSFNAWPRA